MKRRLVAVTSKGPEKPSPAGRIMLSQKTAAVFRNVAKLQGITLDELAQRMLQFYVPRKMRGFVVVFEKTGK